jgi:heptosyltransferase-1
MTRVLFVKTSSLGDVVHQFPAISDAAGADPDARLAWVVEEAFAPVAALHPAVSEVIPVATRRWRRGMHRPSVWADIAAVRRRLRDEAADCVIDTQGLIRSALIARASGARSHGYDRASVREPLASRFYDVVHPVPRDRHAVTRNRMLTAAALGYQVPDALDYGLRRGPFGATHDVVLLHGTSRSAKEWDEANWLKLGNWLQRRGFDVLLPWGNERERSRSQRLAQAIPRSRVIERQPLDHLARLISSAAMVVGVDTGLLHLAAAYQTPLLALFCATDPALTGPLGEGQIQVAGGRSGPPSLDQAIAAAEHLLI